MAKINKKIVYGISFVFASIVSFVFGNSKINPGEDESILLAPIVNADVPVMVNGNVCDTSTYTVDQCNVYFSCFPQNTKIITSNGEKNIQDIVVGDYVVGFDAVTQATDKYKVQKVFAHCKGDKNTVLSPLIKIKHEKGLLHVTENHWIYRENGREGDYKNFDRAALLQVGDELTMHDGTKTKIIEISEGEDYECVYDLSVESVHTYIADGVRVHNSGAGGCCGGCGK